jgi:hypothetical protein
MVVTQRQMELFFNFPNSLTSCTNLMSILLLPIIVGKCLVIFFKGYHALENPGFNVNIGPLYKLRSKLYSYFQISRKFY